MRLAIQEDEVGRIQSSGHWGKPLVWKSNLGFASDFELGVSGYDTDVFPEQKTHDDEEAIYIISGEGTAKIGDELVDLRPGVAIYIPPKTPHCIKRKGTTPLKAVYCHSGNKVDENDL